MAVLPGWRDPRVGRRLLQTILEPVGDKAALWLNAQTDVTGFYKKSGFRQTDAVFMESGIPHQKMTYVR